MGDSSPWKVSASGIVPFCALHSVWYTYLKGLIYPHRFGRFCSLVYSSLLSSWLLIYEISWFLALFVIIATFVLLLRLSYFILLLLIVSYSYGYIIFISITTSNLAMNIASILLVLLFLFIICIFAFIKPLNAVCTVSVLIYFFSILCIICMHYSTLLEYRYRYYHHYFITWLQPLLFIIIDFVYLTVSYKHIGQIRNMSYFFFGGGRNWKLCPGAALGHVRGLRVGIFFWGAFHENISSQKGSAPIWVILECWPQSRLDTKQP